MSCCALVVLAASSGSALLAPVHTATPARRRAVLARGQLPRSSWSRADVVAALAAAALAPSRPAAAVYGEFARMGTGTQDSIAAGDAKNECLFATPGTGICQVYSSGDPKIWQEPDAKAASRKLVNAAQALGGLDEQIRASRWTSISQTLGASRDLREAVGFLVAGNASAGAAAKKVFKDLDGVSLSVQKKSQDAAAKYFKSYVVDMAALFTLLQEMGTAG